MNCALLKDWRWGEAITAHRALWEAGKFHHLILGSVGATYGHCGFFDTLDPPHLTPDRMDMAALARCSAPYPSGLHSVLMPPCTFDLTYKEQRERAEKAEARLKESNAQVNKYITEVNDLQHLITKVWKAMGDWGDIRLGQDLVDVVAGLKASFDGCIKDLLRNIGYYKKAEARVKALEGLCARAGETFVFVHQETEEMLRAAGRGEEVRP